MQRLDPGTSTEIKMTVSPNFDSGFEGAMANIQDQVNDLFRAGREFFANQSSGRTLRDLVERNTEMGRRVDQVTQEKEEMARRLEDMQRQLEQLGKQ
jgi:prefoldin subunit 5